MVFSISELLNGLHLMLPSSDFSNLSTELLVELILYGEERLQTDANVTTVSTIKLLLTPNTWTHHPFVNCDLFYCILMRL